MKNINNNNMLRSIINNFEIYDTAIILSIITIYHFYILHTYAHRMMIDASMFYCDVLDMHVTIYGLINIMMCLSSSLAIHICLLLIKNNSFYRIVYIYSAKVNLPRP